ncbi:peptidoglycan DD-metalloendopeptidase family protein [Bacillus sp. BRMEA1]|uniref:murein hydrolase activator EnvC family protein n=1 Tax=Neobacillus endophyticus TaxID=2738405 RepID=UPI001567215D|nr:M23 family metallopeptidase [Neobacillus endophyticus]NRD76665.1 peptidoglycan DD-metalloendopeptidase family protein [Neobacillus endophyticus]
MRNSVITLAVAVAVGLGTTFGGMSVKTEAASLSSLKDQQEKIQNQRSNVQSNIKQGNDKITNIQNQQSNVEQQMTRLDMEIGDITSKIDDKTAKADSTKRQIAKLEAETKVIQERIKKRTALLKERLSSYQDTGGVVDYLSVLMGAQSFSDFIDRANAVATIMQADQEIIKQHEADKKELAKKQDKVKKDLSSLKKMVADLKNMNKQLNTQKAAKNKLLASLKLQEGEAQNDVMNLQEQDQLLASQEKAIKEAIQLEKDREAEQAAQSAQTAQGDSPSSGGATGQIPSISSGFWTQPAEGIISSGFGKRTRDFHYGVDIANNGPNVPILAAADGVVIRSYLSSSYGNCIFISHSYNGQVFTTVYAHMSERLVGDGAVVKKGQQIGIMGSSGEATGQHLHFELHKGPWTPDKRFAINPVGIIPLP